MFSQPFLREAVLWGQLSHPNVVSFLGIYRLGDQRDRIGLVSPWMENGNLDEYLVKNPKADCHILVSYAVSKRGAVAYTDVARLLTLRPVWTTCIRVESHMGT